jgi:hypothetical protein
MAKPSILINRTLGQKTYNKEFIDKAFNEVVGLPSYNEETQTITFTRKDGATFTVTIPLFDMPFKIDIDEVKKELVFTFENNKVKRVPMSELLINYEGTIGDQIQVVVNPGEAEISAVLLDGSVTKEKLAAGLAAEIGDVWEVEELPED